jgi:hypothetical protein
MKEATMPDVTLSHLREMFSYDPDTGVFTVLKRRHTFCTPVGLAWGYKNNSGYLAGQINKKQYLLHRLAFLYVYGRMPLQIDHINGIRNDNRIANLREVTARENHKNKQKPSNNTSGHVGVSWDKGNERWHATIRVNSKSVFLGAFTEISDAIAARNAANMRFGFHQNHGRTSQ